MCLYFDATTSYIYFQNPFLISQTETLIHQTISLLATLAIMTLLYACMVLIIIKVI